MGVTKMIKKIDYEFGSYKGSLNSMRLPHGKGTFNYFDGSKYIGQFSNGKYHGKGKLIIQEIDVRALGGIKNYRKSKSCKFILLKYKKFYKHMHGFGKYLKQENFEINYFLPLTIIGNWINDTINKGIIKEDPHIYRGKIKRYKEHGEGEVVFTKMEYGFKPGYKGQFKNGTWDGYGVYTDVFDDEYYHIGKEFGLERVEGDKIITVWKGKWKNGFEVGQSICEVNYFNTKRKKEFVKQLKIFWGKGGTSKRFIAFVDKEKKTIS